MNYRLKISKLVQSNLHFYHLNRSAEALLNLSLVQYHLLAQIRDRPGCSPQEIAHLAGIHPSSLTQSLKRLQRRKMIFIEEDPRDSRKKLILLAPPGNQCLNYFERNLQQLFEKKPFKSTF